MGNLILQFKQSIAALPLITMGFTSPLVSPEMFQPSLTSVAALGNQSSRIVEIQKETFHERADKIDSYFKARSMPLAGLGEEMVLAADKNDLDWRLLPAIAIRESSGGKQACNFNPFGWGSCKIIFKSWKDSINTVASHLGGNNPKTADYYDEATTEEKLHAYNGTVLPTYTKEVLAIMDKIGSEN